MKLFLEKSIIFFGLLDISVFLWAIYTALIAGKFPFYSDLIESIEMANAFEMSGAALLSTLAHVIYWTIILSGVLMVMKNKWGVFISLAQAPFRFLLIIPPTLFFLNKLASAFPSASIVFIIIIYVAEIAKIYLQIKWIRIKTIGIKGVD